MFDIESIYISIWFWSVVDAIVHFRSCDQMVFVFFIRTAVEWNHPDDSTVNLNLAKG